MKRDRVKLNSPEAFMEALNRYQTEKRHFSPLSEEPNPPPKSSLD
jgi:hypothetical protein